MLPMQGSLKIETYNSSSHDARIDKVWRSTPGQEPLKNNYKVQSALGGLGGVSIIVQLLGTLLGISIAVIGALAVYGAINVSMGLRLSEEDEFNGADLLGIASNIA